MAALALSAGSAAAGDIVLPSPDLASRGFDETFILNGFGCNGQSISPALEWSGLPERT